MYGPQSTRVDTERYGRAVVIGGSMAGSLAAAGLAQHFDEVLVLDRDTFPDTPDQRRGVPQGFHFHALLAGGLAAIDQLLPEFSKELVGQGAVTASVTSDIRYRQRCGWLPVFEGNLKVVLASRQLIEWVVRKQAGALGTVRYLPSTTALGLSTVKGRVNGVRIRNEQTGGESVLDADLAVDASGRSSKAADWLQELDFPRPSETKVNARWGYTSAFVRVPESWEPGFKAMYCPPLGQGAPEGGAATRGFGLFAQEGDRRWILTVQGSAGDYPPRDEAGLRAYVASIGVPDITEAISRFDFLDSIHVWRDTTNRLRDYAGLTRRPENFVLLGDAVAAFNPVYGQGMTVAALSAVTLSRELTDHKSRRSGDLTGLAERFQKQLDAVIQFCWSVSTGQDYRVPGVKVFLDGKPQQPPTAAAEFSDRLLAYVARDAERYLQFQETNHLLRSPEWLRSEEVIAEIQADWDELGKLVLV
jgi:2-polyprenyl-6-methoxyphenol hydroxylase-like FAD-dependent oxidoreductase